MNYAIRGAHTSYMYNGTFRCADSGHCPRISMLRSLGFDQTISETSKYTFALGLASETLFKKEFPEAQTDVEIRMAISPSTLVIGHADGLLNDVVYELKSISSVKSATETIVKKNYKEGHLLQLLGYMIGLEKQKGVLLYSNFVWHRCKVAKEDVKIQPCDLDFKVEICDDGHITVEGNTIGIELPMIMDAWKEISSCLEEKRLPDRPENWREAFTGPCSFCTLSNTCDLCEDYSSFLQGVEDSGSFIRSDR